MPTAPPARCECLRNRTEMQRCRKTSASCQVHRAPSFESEPPGADFLFVRLGTGAVTENEAPGRAVEIDALAAAPPLIEVVKEFRARCFGQYAYDKPAIGAGDGLCGHCANSSSLG
jgi:hypothetical protein